MGSFYPRPHFIPPAPSCLEHPSPWNSEYEHFETTRAGDHICVSVASPPVSLHSLTTLLEFFPAHMVPWFGDVGITNSL